VTAPTASPAIPRVAIYARCSADKQAEKDLSIPAQLDCCRAGAKQRGWEVVAEYVDAAESATTDDRPQFREMIAAAHEKPAPFDYIVVWKFSRFSRNREDSVLYKRMLERNRVRVVSLNEPVDDSPAGRML
jgi:site-specific DNA recombinase